MSVRWIFSLLRDRRGSSAVEFAIISPVLLMLLVCTVELGLALRMKSLLNDAASAGINALTLRGAHTAVITDAITAATAHADVQVSISSPFCKCPSGLELVDASCITICADQYAARKYMRISVSIQRPSVFPGALPFLPTNLSVSALAVIPL